MANEKFAVASNEVAEGGLRVALADISNEIVQVYMEQFGRGPTKVRTDWAGPDAIICVLQGTFTTAENHLRKRGDYARLRENRNYLQYSETEVFTKIIEQNLNRRVVSFISGIDAKTGAAAEVFLLEPRDDGPSNGEPASGGVSVELTPSSAE